MQTLDIILVFCNQLFEKNDLIAKSSVSTHIIFYEMEVYFTKYKYHKLRLAFARAAFKNYADYVEKKYKRKVKYVNFDDDFASVIPKNIANYTSVQIQTYDSTDHDVTKWIEKELVGFFPSGLKKDIKIHTTPMFLCSLDDIKTYNKEFDIRGQKTSTGQIYKQTSFYIWQRKRLKLLVTSDEKPIGGKWTFDKENRLPFPNAASGENYQKNKSQSKPNPYDTVLPINTTKYAAEAIKYVEGRFPANPGELNNKSLYLPTDHAGAKKQFTRFLAEKLECFGPYQDASREDIVFGCHTVISPLLNVGLLTPRWVVDTLIAHWNAKSRALTGAKKQKLLESVEALLRQIIGWREIVRVLYNEQYSTMVKSNLFKHTKKLPKEWYENPFAHKSTKLQKITPVQTLLKKVWKISYANHIERLMYLGAFMLLCEFSPQSIHDWFMCMFIDSYQWVMAANVYAMSQYATPMLMTKPYFSSANYIMKMSGVSAGANSIKTDDSWQTIWNALYYAFIAKHKTYFAKNYSTARGVYHWNQKTQSEKNKILKTAKKYLGDYE